MGPAKVIQLNPLQRAGTSSTSPSTRSVSWVYLGAVQVPPNRSDPRTLGHPQPFLLSPSPCPAPASPHPHHIVPHRVPDRCPLPPSLPTSAPDTVCPPNAAAPRPTQQQAGRRCGEAVCPSLLDPQSSSRSGRARPGAGAQEGVREPEMVLFCAAVSSCPQVLLSRGQLLSAGTTEPGSAPARRYH